MPSGQHAHFFVDALGRVHVIPTAFQGSLGGLDFFSANGLVKFYFDPGIVIVNLGRDQAVGTGGGFIMLDGYFVTI